jgi:hypothetical protein
MHSKAVLKSSILEWVSKYGHALMILPPAAPSIDEFEAVFQEEIFQVPIPLFLSVCDMIAQASNRLFTSSTTSQCAPVLVNIWTGIFAPLSQVARHALSCAAALVVVRDSSCNTSWHPSLKVCNFVASC